VSIEIDHEITSITACRHLEIDAVILCSILSVLLAFFYHYSMPSSRNRSLNTLFNTLFSVAFFLSLVQVFDPFQLRPSEDYQQLSQNNPMLASLQEFEDGRDTMRASSGNLTREQVSIGREPILELLEEAGVKDLSVGRIQTLPKWTQVVELYGDETIVVGMDRCEEYRRKTPPSEVYVAVAGLFNTGTNLLEYHLRMNLKHPANTRHSRGAVPWGKHRPAAVKWTHTADHSLTDKKEYALPVVIVRDPLQFMQSMCRHPYSTKWRHGDHHCPNLVPSDLDRTKYKNLQETFGVTVKFDSNSSMHTDSLAELWSSWYNEYYVEVDYPILMIRFEDLVFRPVSVMEKVAECMGGVVNKPFRFQLRTSKSHGSGTDFVKAVVKTGDAVGRTNSMTAADLEYARQHLGEELMSRFRYHVP
jgi:hypothetical protein